jgi:hypothetical protein
LFHPNDRIKATEGHLWFRAGSGADFCFTAHCTGRRRPPAPYPFRWAAWHARCRWGLFFRPCLCILRWRSPPA